MSGKCSSVASWTGKRSIVFRHLFSCPLLLGMGAILSPATHSQTHQKTPVAPHFTTIEQNGFFYGEEQVYVVTPPVIHVYYQPAAGSDAASKKTTQRSSGRRLHLQPNGDKYFHEIFALVKGEWTKKFREISKKPDTYLSANSCDSTNESDLPSPLMSQALPHPIKIKEIKDYQDYAVVVFSDTPNQNEWYSLKTALLEREPSGWHMVSTMYGGSFVHFCGTSTFHIRLSSGDEPLDLLIYSGWSDSAGREFISIQSFVIWETKAHLSGQKK
jgi:hypothetical protein